MQLRFRAPQPPLPQKKLSSPLCLRLAYFSDITSACELQFLGHHFGLRSEDSLASRFPLLAYGFSISAIFGGLGNSGNLVSDPRSSA